MCSVFIPISLGFNVKVPKIEQPSILGSGKTLYVGGSGPSNYTTIQSAIYDAVDGDTVFVYDDSSPYYEYIIIDKSLNLLGENMDTTIIDMNISNDVINIIADDVIISGFTVQNSGTQSVSSININSNSNIIKENLISCSFGDGIIITNANNIAIENNIIKDNYYQGIRISDSNDIRIKRNDIYSIGNSGIYTRNVNGLLILGNTFVHNFILAWDIDLDDTECIIKRNTFYSFYGGIYLTNCKNCIVTENNFMNKNCKVTFLYLYPSCPRNSNNNFDNNYWYKPRVIPKLISGFIMPSSYLLFLLLILLRILPPCFHIDWHPAQEPHDIEGVV